MGYDNLEAILNSNLAGTAHPVPCLAKFASWAVALGR